MTGPRARGVVVAAVALAAALAECRHGIFPMDEGSVLNAGQGVLSGRTLYERCHVNYGPGLPWLLAGMFRLLGTDVLWPRLFTAASFVLLVLLVRSILRPPLADVAALSLVGMRALFFPYWVMVSYTPCALLCYLGALGAILKRRFVLAGVLAGGAFVFKQNIGGLAILLMPAIAALAARDRPDAPADASAASPATAALRVAAATLLPLGAMLALLAATGTLPGYFQDAILDNARLGDFWRVPYPAFLHGERLEASIFAYVPSRVFSLHFSHPRLMGILSDLGLLHWLARTLFLLPPAAIALALVRAARERTAPGAGRRMAIALAAAGLLPAAWPSTTVLHFTTPMVGSVAAACVWAEGSRRRERAAGALLLATAAAGLTLTLLARSWETTPVRFSTGTLVVDAGSARRYQRVLDFLASELAPGEPLLVIPYHPFFYFASGHENPTADDLLLPPWILGARLEAIVELVRSRRLPVIVWSRAEFPTIGRFESYASSLTSAIEDHYEVALPSPPDRVWVRREPPGAARGGR